MRQLFLMAVFWGTIPIAFIDPFYGIVHYTLINIIRPEQLLWGGSVGRIFYADQIVCFIAWLIKRGKLTPEYTPTPLQTKILWLLALEMIIVTFGFAFDQDWSWLWTLGFIKLTVFCFVMSKAINTAKKLEQYYAVSLVWLMLLALWGIQQKLGGNERLEGLGGVLLPDSNAIAALYVMYFPMGYYTLFSRKKWIKFYIGIPAFVIFTIFIIFTDSRGAFLGMAVCMLVIFLRTKGVQKFKMLFTLVIVGSLLGGILSLVAPEGFFDEYIGRLATILGEEDETTGEVEHEGSAESRIVIWKAAWHVYKNHPEYWLFGVGIHCWTRMYYEYHIDEIAEILSAEELPWLVRGGRGGKDMHNSYLNLLLGGGAVTFLTWIFLIFYCWFQAHNIPWKYPQIVDGVDIHNYARAIEVGIIGWGVTMIFGTRELIDFFYWYLMMPGIIANLGKAKLKREELGAEDEEFVGEFAGRSPYSPYSY